MNRLPADTEASHSEFDACRLGYPDIGRPARIPRADLDHGIVRSVRDEVDGTADDLD